MHLWREPAGLIVEHWACRDDLGLSAQAGLWTSPAHDLRDDR